MKDLLSYALIVSHISLSLSCPSNEYIYCAEEHSSCDISGNIKKGYISYGAEGRYTLIPFSNTAGNTLTMECDNDNGDIYPGLTKHCCYIAAENEFDDTLFTDTLPRDINIFEDRYSMRYGANNKYVYRVVEGTTGWCSNWFFNDPSPGINSHCQYSSNHPSVLSATEWTFCGNERNDCVGLDEDSAYWVRYGVNGDYYHKLVVSSDGSIPCNNAFFEDPSPGPHKFCERSNAQYSFSGAVGSWERIPSCGGCASNIYTKTVGIEELEEEEMSETWATTLTETMSANYEFAGVEMSASMSNSVTQSTKTSFKISETDETEYVCNKNAVYQWYTDVTQNNGIKNVDFTITSEDFWCIDTGLEPQCPPGFCSDDNCQECILS